MSVAVVESPTILHNAVQGRVRIHLPSWSGQGKADLEAQLQQMPGVESVQANALTRNILIRFNSAETDEQTILRAISRLPVKTTGLPDREPARPIPLRERSGKKIRARIPIRGLDRDPSLAKRVIERLETHPGVSAEVSHLTGRVLVEFTEHAAYLDDLIADVVGLELPELPGEDRPAYPLDPGPLIQGMTRVVGASLGLGLLAGRKLLATEAPLPGAAAAIQISSIISILQGIPPIRYGLRRSLGRTLADLVVNIPSIITLTLSGNPLGLTLVVTESLRLTTEAYARRQAWRQHEERLNNAAPARPEAIIQLEPGERPPLPATVLEGCGTGIGRDGMPFPVTPGSAIPPGAQLYGGPFVVKLQAEGAFEPCTPQPRPADVRLTLYERYTRILTPISLLFAVGTGLLTRSITRALVALLLLNPRTAAIGLDGADLGASARVIRAGATVVGTRKNRPIRLPHSIILDGSRVLSDGLEVIAALPLSQEYNTAELLGLGAGVAAAASSPWGNVFRGASAVTATQGSFDGKTATALIEGVPYTLGSVEDWRTQPEAARLRQRGNYVLALRSAQVSQPLGLIALRPRLAPGLVEFVQTCRSHHVAVGVLAVGDELATRALARRTSIPLLGSDSAIDIIRSRQQQGQVVAFVSDNAGASPAFSACDLAIGLTNDRYHLPARADILAPDLGAIAAIIEAGARREATIQDSVGLSVISNIVGLAWGLRSMPGIEQASRTVSITSLGALADSWLRLRGGERRQEVAAYFADPHPERWGRRSSKEALRLLRSSPNGLTTQQVAGRRRAPAVRRRRHLVWSSLLEQIRSPLVIILGAGAGLFLLLGAVGDLGIISITILANAAVGVWQEYKANRVSDALERIGSPTARVRRDGRVKTIAASDLVPGDILELATGDRVAADARLLSAEGLEADESALTGESLPVAKTATGGTDSCRIVLEGSDVTSGTGRAVVFAVGSQTRMGATVAALASKEKEQNPLATRLARLLRLILPVSFASGALVMLIGLLRRQPLMAIVTVGASLAVTGIPEGLPLLSRASEAGVARRLASRRAVVRRLSSIEALGRVDVACTDKTGTITEGRLRVSLVTDDQQEATLPTELPDSLRYVLLTAGFASPHPNAPGANAHPTDASVIQAARDAGLGEQLLHPHDTELSFDPVRSFHATVVQGRLCLKGAPETLLTRCSQIRRNGQIVPMDEIARQAFLARSQQLASQGLRVLMVAEGSASSSIDQPRALTALGYVGISDPLKPDVPEAVRRCHEAGVRIIMITGDHPATAQAIGRKAGLLDHNDEAILVGEDLEGLQNGELDSRLERVSVIARATPLDKLRIVESLQRSGHTVAMTGDGVNDAPALRLANIGVAMGRRGTEVARQTADVVLVDDNFSTLVEALVEGRSFWRNIRRALGLLLGGNLGELGLVAGASVLGFNLPLTTSQILAMNAITDILPATAVALQQPESHRLAGLHREGATALDKPLRNDILRRSLATALPSLVVYGILLATGNVPQAQSAAYASVIVTQLAQTLDAGRYEGGLTQAVLGAVVGSLAVLGITFTVPPIRQFLSLVVPTPFGWFLIGSATVAAVVLSRLFALLPDGSLAQAQMQLPAPATASAAL
jgi:cation-transporting ATPase I